MSKITAYNPITEVESDDLLIVVDVNDTSMAPTGTDKKMTLGQLYGNLAPWQFTPEAYGAKGDGKIGTGGTGTSGTKAFSDAGASFTSGDIGKVIIINQGAGGGNTNPLTSTITAVGSSTAVTLNDNLGSNAASAPYIYGTDDAAAINSAIAAAAAYAAANNQKAQVVFGNKFYMLGAITQTTSPTRYNTHIPLPFANATAAKLEIDLIGAGFSPVTQYWEGAIPQLAGTTLVSAITPPSQPDATYGQFSVIGGPNNGSNQAGNFCNAHYTMDGITLCAPWNSFACGFDGLYLAQMSIPTGRAEAFAPVNFSSATVGGPWMSSSNSPTNDVAVAFRFPTWLNNAFSFAGYLITEAWSIGVDAAEHLEVQFLLTEYADRGLQISNATISPVAHGLTIRHWSCNESNHGVYVTGATGGAMIPVSIDLMDLESIAVDHVSDTGNNLCGTVYWVNQSATHPVVNGGENLIVVDIGRHFPGPWSGAPAAPAEAVAQQNLSYRYATIYVTSSAAISAIAVGPASGSLTSITQSAVIGAAVVVRVPPGSWYSVTSAGGTLATSWVLD